MPIIISLYSHGKRKLFILAGRSGGFIILKLYKKVDFPLTKENPPFMETCRSPTGFVIFREITYKNR